MIASDYIRGNIPEFNNKSVIKKNNEVSLFLTKINEQDLYLKHRLQDEYYYTSFLFMDDDEVIYKTMENKSKDGLNVQNVKRNNELKKLLENMNCYINLDQHLMEVGEFISNHYDKIFMDTESQQLKRSQKDLQLVEWSRVISALYKPVIDELTGELYIYNKDAGIYEAYDDLKLSRFLQDRFGEPLLLEEVRKIKEHSTR